MRTYIEIRIKDKVSKDLATRMAADKFFDNIEKLSSEKIVVNFSGVIFMSRSFAHEYLTRAAESNKYIEDTHVPVHVNEMFELVKESKGTRAPHISMGRVAALHI